MLIRMFESIKRNWKVWAVILVSSKFLLATLFAVLFASSHGHTLMGQLAEWLWNPFLSFVYLELGVLFFIVTGGAAWRKSFAMLCSVLKNDSSGNHDRQVTHKKALLAAIAASVGVGNLAGVGTAIHLGGPGALFWMWLSALAGMSFRMTSTYLALKNRPDDIDSPMFATPMSYLSKYMKGPWAWVPIAVASLILFKGLITANLIQSNSVAHAFEGYFQHSRFVVAVLLSSVVGVVILGGLRRIVDYSSLIAPWMVLAYVGAGAFILISNPLATLGALRDVFANAFTPASAVGGAAGYTVLQTVQFGVSRGVFSHTSGIGLAPFLQGSNTDHPSRGALMAAITPFVDTIIICTITGLVVISDSLWPDYTGAKLTVLSFVDCLGAPGEVLIITCLVVFAFTTIISFEYYSERCYQYLGGKDVMAYRWFFSGVTFIGPFFPVAFVWSFGDVVIGLLVLLHLLPMTYVLLKNSSTLRADLAYEPRPCREKTVAAARLRRLHEVLRN